MTNLPCKRNNLVPTVGKALASPNMEMGWEDGMTRRQDRTGETGQVWLEHNACLLIPPGQDMEQV